MDVFVQFHTDLQRLILLNLYYDEQKKICSLFPDRVPTFCKPNDELMVMRLGDDFGIQKPFTLRKYYDMMKRLSEKDEDFYYEHGMYEKYIKTQPWNGRKLNNLIDDEVFLKNHVNDTDMDDLSILSYLAGTDETPELMVKLLQNGADINRKQRGYGRTPLIRAIDAGNIDVIQFLIDNGANINQTFKHGRNDEMTPLLYAIHIGEYEIAKLLIQNKPNLDYQELNGNTALIFASSIHNKSQREELIKLLLEAGADPSIVNNRGETYQDILQRWDKISDDGDDE
jgi:hypothetical protein